VDDDGYMQVAENMVELIQGALRPVVERELLTELGISQANACT